MIVDKVKYGWRDLAIVPCDIPSKLDSRSSVDVHDSKGMLPLFASPMCSVTDESNYDIWVENGIQAILPRTVPYNNRMSALFKGKWVAYGQNEFKKIFVDNVEKLVEEIDIEGITDPVFYVSIDTANAHRLSIFETINAAKELAASNGYKLVVMVGNIANPETYKWICINADVDYVRLIIGNGKGCITSTQTGVNYPTASLTAECREVKNELISDMYEFGDRPKSLPYIVADGGIRTGENINIALACGADYVMLGSLLAAFDESAAQYGSSAFDGAPTKRYFGMSTKTAQALINAALENPVPTEKFVPKTSEGTYKDITCTGSVEKWVENFKDYLKSAMIYTDSANLEEFTSGKVKLVPKSDSAIFAINE